MIIYILIFFVLMCFAIEYEVGNNKTRWPFFLFVVFLALFAGMRSPQAARDYELYVFAYDNIEEVIQSPSVFFFKIYEPAFIWVVVFFKWIFTNWYVLAIMMFFACSSVFLKANSILKYSINPFLVLLVYYSNYYILHEMTQIRIGLASAIYLFSLRYYINGKLMAFLGMVLLAFLFHYSAILFLATLFFRKDHFSRIWFVILLLLTVPFAFLRLPLDQYLGIYALAENTNEKFEAYSNLMQNDVIEAIRVFNVMNIIKILICAYLLYIVPKEDFIKDRYLSLFLKLTITSIFILAFTSGVPLAAFRLSDLFGIASIFLFPYLVKYLPFKKYNIWLVILITFTYFYINVFYAGLLKPYSFYVL